MLQTQFIHNYCSVVFDNLQHSVINVNSCLKDYHFLVLAYILRRSPNLETLSFLCSENVMQPKYATVGGWEIIRTSLSMLATHSFTS